MFSAWVFSCKFAAYVQNSFYKEHPWVAASIVSMKIDNVEIENTSPEKLLGIIIDRKLYFKKHLEGIIKKARRKVNVVSRITTYMNLAKRKLLMNLFFTSQFNYCSLVWMFHNRTIDNKINRLHERCLRIVYNHHFKNY